MSQSTSPLSFFTYPTLIFPYLKQESTYLCTCIVEKSILEFGTAISALLIADSTNKKKNTGLHKDNLAAKTPFRICISNYNRCCVPYEYPLWNRNKSWHILRWQDTFNISKISPTQLNRRRCSLRTIYKSAEETLHWHQCISLCSRVTFFPPKQFRASASTPPQAHSSMTSFCSFLAIWKMLQMHVLQRLCKNILLWLL